jgi:hypothetical protein
MKIERFEDIEAWQLARELTQNVYRLTKKQGFAKDYGVKNTYRPMNSKMSTSKPDEHALPFVDSSTISRNMKIAR